MPPVLDKEIRIPGKTAYLRALKKPQADLSLQAIAQKDDKNLYLIIRFAEPEMNRLKISSPEAAKKNIWNEALAEFFLNPSGDRRKYYHIAVHPSGCFEAISYPDRQPWKADISVRSHTGKDLSLIHISEPTRR